MDGLSAGAYGDVQYILGNFVQPVGSVTLAVAAANVTYTVVNAFNRVWCTWRAASSFAATNETIAAQFNADSGSHYLWQDLQGINSTAAGSSPGAATTSIVVGQVPGASATANYFGSGDFLVDGCNQSASFMTTQGTGTTFISTSSTINGVYSGQYNVLAKLTSITLIPGAGNFVAGSQFTFYGMN